VTAYIGFDPTAPSLHAGGLIQIMLLHWLQKTGHRPVSLMGGGTGMVGDPSFKDEARKLMTPETIGSTSPASSRSSQTTSPIGDGPKDAMMINNADWLLGLNYLEFLRDVGRHFSVNRMLSFDSVKLRLEREQSLSFLEFNYMILQAYDFVELNKRYDVRLQMGGSDQWGNIINGIDLGHRMGTPQLFAVTTPLLTTASGGKMGKSMTGAVWLNADMLPPLRLLAVLAQHRRRRRRPLPEALHRRCRSTRVARLAALGGAEINEAKKLLATEVTAMLHGREAAEQAAETARKTFEEGALAESLPTIEIPMAELEAGIGVLALFVRAGLAASNGEARRHVQGGAVRVNDQAVSDDKRTIGAGDIGAEGVIKLSLGKKKHVLVRPS
jgi:tyrosyl-tRNA synthetase